MRGSQVRFLPGSPPIGPFPSAFWSAPLVLLLHNHRGSVSQNFSYTLHNLELVKAKDVLFWLLLGGFVWVIGDVFQQYAAKYVGISRGIPLSNTNQFWGTAWGILVFGELRGRGLSLYAQVIGGSLLMAAGAGAIALSSVTGKEH